MPSHASILLHVLAAWLHLFAATVSAGFNAAAQNNLAVYWGQNSINIPTGQAGSQQRLSYYCSNSKVNIIPMAFLNVILNPMTVNFANAGDRCSTFPGTTLLDCPEIEADIQTCQAQGKTILLSIGGATYTEGGFSSANQAVAAADKIWAAFGPVQANSNALRPFGAAVVDGFDLDFESTLSNLVPFAARLRALMDGAASTKKFYLTAAPQCVYPDAAVGSALSSSGVFFDFLMVQFYNNWCGAQNYQPGVANQPIFNFAVWDQWAAASDGGSGRSKVLVGVPGSAGAAGTGYQSASSVAAVIAYCKRFASFGGLMVWDASQAWANGGWLDDVAAALNGVQPPPATTTTPTSPPPTTTLVTVTRTTTSTTPTATATGGAGVPQWGQCGGNGYTGPTVCQPPYKCVASSQWWSQCE